MNKFILSISFFLILLICVIVILWKTQNITKYNIFIYLSLFFMWLTMYVFKSGQGNPFSKPWIWPIVVSTFQFTQAAFRLPLGMLSQKIRSRKNIIQLCIGVFIICAAITVITNFSLASIVATMVAAGLIGSTFGLNSQYWAENWDIRRAFHSTGIIFTLPISALILSRAIDAISSYNDFDFKWLLVITISIATLNLIQFSFVKENKETIRLDNMVSGDTSLIDKSLKHILVISTEIAFLVFIFAMITSKDFASLILSNQPSLVHISSVFVSLIGSLLTAFYLIKKYRIHQLKLIALYTTAGALIIGLVLILYKSYNLYTWLPFLILLSLGVGIYQVVLFGTALHFDHKHRLLILGIFLSIRSFAIGAGKLTGQELVVFQNSYLGLEIAFGLACGLALSGIIFAHYHHKRTTKEIEEVVQKYEFKNHPRL